MRSVPKIFDPQLYNYITNRYEVLGHIQAAKDEVVAFNTKVIPRETSIEILNDDGTRFETRTCSPAMVRYCEAVVWVIDRPECVPVKSVIILKD